MTILAQLLRGWANQIAARFNAPVYLVGSALREARPRDVDVRVVLRDEAFVARYGLNIDFQIQSDALAPKYAAEARIRLDTLDVPIPPEEIL